MWRRATGRAAGAVRPGKARVGFYRGLPTSDAGRMPEKWRGDDGPGETGRLGPRRQWPGMKPGHHGRPGMKRGRPERAFIEDPTSWNTTVAGASPRAVAWGLATRPPHRVDRGLWALTPPVLGTGAHKDTGPAPPATPDPARRPPTVGGALTHRRGTPRSQGVLPCAVGSHRVSVPPLFGPGTRT